MKKLLVFTLLTVSVIVFSYCNPSKKTAATTVADAPKEVKAASLYTGNVETIIMSKCAPCHIPPGGNKTPFNSYASVKANIDEIIKRIELNPTDKGFMPFKKTEKLDSATINVFKQWKADGMIEK